MKTSLLLGRAGTPGAAVCLVLCLTTLPGPARGQDPAAGVSGGALSIEHEAPACVRSGQYARLSACFRPEGSLARGRVYFRPNGAGDWFYVEMTGTPPCLQGVLPRPGKDLETVEYYVSGMDREFAESRTADHSLLVTDSDTCATGVLAPVAESASVIIGSATGAAPVGFVTGGGTSTGLILGVVGGAAAAGAAVVIAGGGGGDEPLAPTPTTTTTTTTTTTSTTTTTTTTTTRPPTPTTTTTTTTTTTLPACETDPPLVSILQPSTGTLLGTSALIRASASDADSGVKEVRFYYQYCPVSMGGLCGPNTLIGVDSGAGPTYETTWSFPNCSFENDKWTVVARAEDNCGNTAESFVDDLILGGRGCFRSGDRAADGSGATWVSELGVAGGRGQVVVDGAQASFPGPGTVAQALTLAPGPHRFEAVLVDGQGEPGVWRFDLSMLGADAGSLRVVAGEVSQLGPGLVAFQMSGQPGERVVFTLRTGD